MLWNYVIFRSFLEGSVTARCPVADAPVATDRQFRSVRCRAPVKSGENSARVQRLSS